MIQRTIQEPLALKILAGEFPEGSEIVADAPGDGKSLEFRAG